MRVAIAKLPIEKLAAATLIAAAVSCAPAPRIMLPVGMPSPAPETVVTWQTTTAACRAAANYSAQIVIDGHVGTEKLRRVTLHSGFTRDGRIRLEAVAPIGGPIFVMAGRANRATLTLPHDHRVLSAPVDDIVNALIGVKFAPADWVDVLSGCLTGAADGRPDSDIPANVTWGGYVGADILMSVGPVARALLRKSADGWQVVAGERPGAEIEYLSYLGRWPSEARITSAAGSKVPIDLRLAISQIFVNSELSDKAFTIDVPADFTRMTLEELRAIGPLGASKQ